MRLINYSKFTLCALLSLALQALWAQDNTHTHSFGSINFNTTSNIVGNSNDASLFSDGVHLSLVDNNNQTYPYGYGTLVTFKKRYYRAFQMFHSHLGSNRLWIRNLYNSSAYPSGYPTQWDEVYHTGNLGTGVSSRIPFWTSSTKLSNDASFIWDNSKKGLIIGVSALPAGFKLAVAGKIIAEEVVVKLQDQWPDYVFEPEYTLRPLAEVEAHIQTHGHLPEVPSAQQVEELTLYVIELKKDNNQLKETSKKVEELGKLIKSEIKQ